MTQYDIAVVNADGSGLTNLTDDPALDHDPAWSPDGTRIAFSSTRTEGDAIEIFLMGSDGSGIRQLTHDPTPLLGGDYLSMGPAWSPGGESIAFVRGTTTTPTDVCVVDVEGGGEFNVSMDPEFDSMPEWSPDGSQMIFVDGTDRLMLYSAGAIGTPNIRPLASEGGSEPAWSPDGSKIAFVAGGPPSSNSAIWVMNADGTGREQLTDGSTSDRNPDWQPVPGSGTPSTPAGGTAPAPVPASSRCVPVWPERYSQPGAPVADTIPVGGGSVPGSEVDFTYRQAALVAAGLVLIAASFLALGVSRRL